MAAVLEPMRLLGSIDPLFYAELDFAGVETLGWSVAPTDFTGFNEIVRFSRDAYDWLLIEHFDNGVHKTLKIAKAVFYARYGNNAYTIDDDLSYVQDTNGAYVQASTTVAGLNRTGPGAITVDLFYPLANTNYRVFDATPCSGERTVYDPTTGLAVQTFFYARAWLSGITDANTFDIIRKEWTNWTTATWALADGDFCIGVFGT